ncbi:aminotransferase family protein (LolT) [Moelleriella libera RCEF 2490]|uniref:Aminotransferase family protein (LolT) n=1 Tax=Moelleriella libera RCEF 2490 TaxID=1081109 RepID=A0A168EP34_9HYPO|nr:aminotransferase family protein (LolT) [Moelleriella libera RCEF 2490]
MGSQDVVALRSKTGVPVKPFGHQWREDFLFDPEWHNLNHGSYGTYPLAIRDKLRAYQDQGEARPDQFLRFREPKLLDASRAAVASLINAPLDTVVFVGNATEGVNTVLRNLVWGDADDGSGSGSRPDVVFSFSTAYEACAKAVDYLAEYHGSAKLEHREIPLQYPVEDADIVRAFREAVRRVRQDEGKRARLAMFDVVSSRPGVVFPWEELVAACRELGVLSLVDGAQGIGMVPLEHLTDADPDFFVSNCHKWLHVPRGCAFLYTPLRNQHLIRTTVATSHGFVPRSAQQQRTNPLPPREGGNAFTNNFAFVGTKDTAPYLCVKDAVAWRRDRCGGEDAIRAYLWDLNKRGVRLVAERLGTTFLDNAKGTMTNCAMGNVALPVLIVDDGEDEREGDSSGGGGTTQGSSNSSSVKNETAKSTDVPVARKHQGRLFQWVAETLVGDYKTFVSQFMIGNRYWVRISAQIYLELKDYELAADVLTSLCERIKNKEYLE